MIQYISPLSFLPPETTSTLSPGGLKLAKHKLMAEFELLGTSTIQIGKRELSRNDVIKIFDELARDGQLEFHMLIASSPVLRHFLEHMEIKPEDRFNLPEEKVTAEFIDWVSPYYSWAFRKTTTRIFRNVLPAELEALVINPQLMNDSDTWEAWTGVETHMQQVLKEFMVVSSAKYHTDLQVKKFAGYDFIWLLCNLPQDRFRQLIDDYAFGLMQIAIIDFNTNIKDRAFETLGYARSLRVSDEMMSALQAKEEEMRRIMKKAETSQSNRKMWNILRVVLFIAYILTRVATCDTTPHY